MASFDHYVCGYWLPQVETKRPKGSGASVSKALDAFLEVFGISSEESCAQHPLALPELDLFELRRVSELMSQDKQRAYIFGTAPYATAIEQSWQIFGLNLFDLPWHLTEEEKVFKYISLLTLPRHLVELRDFARPSGLLAPKWDLAKEQLEWAGCHQFAIRMQEAVAHGNRDRFQTMSWREISSSLDPILLDTRWSNLPCKDSCGLKQRARELFKRSDLGDPQKGLALAQEAAALDCSLYRLAASKYFAPVPVSDVPRFKRIIILEDNDSVRELLTNELEAFLLPGGKIELANPKKSWLLYRLADDRGDIIRRCIDDEGIPTNEILACFDLDIGRENKPDEAFEWITDIFGGIWIMYGTARAYPRVPRLIISGFRSQDVSGYAADGCAYMLKPFTTPSLTKEITRAAVRRRVSWLCPPSVQADYAKLFEGTVPFSHVMLWLKQRLAEEGVCLDLIEEVATERIVGSDLIVVDLVATGSDNSPRVVLEALERIRYANPRGAILLALPREQSVQENVSEYRRLPLMLRAGEDAIIKKPTWIVADGHQADSNEGGLDNAILKLLNSLDDFDVKYQVVVPKNAIDKLLLDAGSQKRVEQLCKNQKSEEVQRIHRQVKIDQLIKPLTQVFGGSTMYEDRVRGSWYETAEKSIDDDLVMVEFCAKSSIVARRFVETTVVNYLRHMAGEQAVLIQEIQLRGYFK
jgi:hypothetical protein